ncbi:hypothetical protein B4O97_15665 [Marispirochaeta aestuarii]|uniref:diguanylate cyclase n=1 Tax=Marispirochaeta aestuarii TaxID=1963862 RepID=A0A1Y1RVN0_9SPIO|nr:diguanylate cyclase [Marispirochaeta aestuarii]ORC32731.1 hypothetical protein B4O97_15665 [Marispirochaeta aestuarii]
MTERVFLRGVDIFSTLCAEELEILAGLLKRRLLRRGELLFSEGDDGEEMFIVESGRMGVSVALEKGGDLEVAEFGPREFFGEMSIFEGEPRSASCKAKEDCSLFSLKAGDFFSLAERYPETSNRIMHRMLNITARRLRNTNRFLTEMVSWGESARKRAVTDELTGLYNRGFFDVSLKRTISEALSAGEPLCLAMADLDGFGRLNSLHGEETCNLVIRKAAEVFRQGFSDGDILTRYGGDEFAFILPGRNLREAKELCDDICRRMQSLRIETNRNRESILLSTSIGIAALSDRTSFDEDLVKMADEALYRAKETGRGRALSYSGGQGVMRKSDIPSIAAKNRIVLRIIEALLQSRNVLVLGHRNSDEDCIASMVAISLLVKKLNRNVSILLTEQIHERFHYLLNICRYNAIHVIPDCSGGADEIDTICVVDTPKPEMLQICEGAQKLLASPRVRVIEFDHHLAADSAYIAPRETALVTTASSTCELIGFLALKMRCLRDRFEEIDGEDLFSRNFVLAVLTGIVGDSKMGKFIKNHRERWFYKLFSSRFSRMLSEKTHQTSSNLSSMEDIFKEITRLSQLEERCFKYFMKYRQSRGCIAYTVLDEEMTSPLPEETDIDLFVATARSVADALAEESGCLGMVAYHDPPEVSDLIQFRIRRSHSFQNFDLREILSAAGIENGGGHEGAIGFRIPKKEISDIREYCSHLTDIIIGLFTPPQGKVK